MEINKEIILGNGLEISYIVIYSIEVETNQNINVELHYFKDKEHFNKAIKKNNLRKEQDDLINELNELQLKDSYDEEKANTIHTKINQLAYQINDLKEYNEYLIKTNIISIPYINDYNEEYILEEINLRI